MTRASYWATLSCDGKELGGGFFVSRRFVLTAAHCLRRLPSGRDDLTVSVAQDSAEARVEQVLDVYDLALVRVLDPDTLHVRPAVADDGRVDDRWFAPFRPSVSDPHLSGTVVDHAVDYECEGGGTITALQLEAQQDLGDFRGYSGGPVERHAEDGAHAVLGLLLEQYFERGDPGRAANVLFAAAIGQALRRFDYFDVANLLSVLSPEPAVARTPAPVTPADDRTAGVVDQTKTDIAATELKLRALRRWAKSGLIDPGDLPELRLRLAQSFVDDAAPSTGGPA